MSAVEHSPLIFKLSNHSFCNISNVSNYSKIRRKTCAAKENAILYNDDRLQQLYTGIYEQQCFHNIGTYRWVHEDDVYQYEGKIYANNLHGYGTMTYPDNSIFEGLYKENKRFGPGILTYPEGFQDVGIWNGNYLIRLSQYISLSDFYNAYIPILGKTIQSKVYLLQYKHLVSIDEKYKDPAKDCFKKYDPSDDNDTHKESQKLYSKLVRNPKSMFFNQKLFHETYFIKDEDFTVDIVDYFDEDETPVMKKVVIENLLAWNNGKQNIEIMKHAFLHRQFEKLLKFKVREILSDENRSNFGIEGPVEIISIEFLRACREKDSLAVTKIICENDVYPDLSDSRGNNSVTYAAFNDRVNVIRTLKNFGANLDNFNDDCLTPLMFSILRYLATKYDIPDCNWEYSFLPQKTDINTLPAEIIKWPVSSCYISRTESTVISSEGSRPRKSTKGSISPRVSERRKRRKTYYLQSLYFFDFSCNHPDRKLTLADIKPASPVKDNDSTISKKGKAQPKKKSELTILLQIIPEEDIYAPSKEQQLIVITKTVLTLLQCGANPNICEVPFYPLITACFTRSKEIIEYLVAFGADMNIKTSEEIGSLTPLHIIATLNPCPEMVEMAKVLLENGANPDILCSESHWLEEQVHLLAGVSTENEKGKTPLHLLCIRYDFLDDKNHILNDLAMQFLQYGADLNIKYLGHTPLTLAMVKGNVMLMECLLNSRLVNPNEGLGNGMGVPLTIFTLKRFNKIFPLPIIKIVYAVLSNYYANAFADVPGFDGHAIEFAKYENTPIPDPIAPKANQKKKKKKQKKETPNPIIKMLEECAGKTLMRHIEGRAVCMLYKYKILCGLESFIFDNIVKFLDTEKTTNILQIFLDNDKVLVAPNKLFCEMLLNYVIANRPPGATSGKKKKVTKKQKTTFIIAALTGNEIVETLHFTKTEIDLRQKLFLFKNFIPEVDPDYNKFKVCFKCYLKTGKTLIVCPKCELVYFCSQKCNTADVKDKKSKHPCKFSFYDAELEKIKLGIYPVSQFDRMETVRREIMLRFGGNLDNISGDIVDFLSKLAEATSSLPPDSYFNMLSKDGTNESDMSLATRTKKGLVSSRFSDDRTGRTGKGGKSISGRASKSRRTSSTDSKKRGTKSRRSTKSGRTSRSSKSRKSKSGRGKDGEDEDGGSEAKMLKAQKEKEVQEARDAADLSSGQTKGAKEGLDKDMEIGADGKPKTGIGFDSTKTSQTFGEDKYKKIRSDIADLGIVSKYGKAGDAVSCTSGILVTVGSRVPIDYAKRAMFMGARLKPGECDKKPPLPKEEKVMTLRDRLKSKFRITANNKHCTEQMLKLMKRLSNEPITDEYKDKFSQVWQEFDYKFWQMFMPYCIFINGQLYYKFNDGDVYYRFTYSDV